MIHFDLPKEKSSIIKVIGVGGGGGNAVNYMFSQGIEGVNFIICNTDAQALANSSIPNRVQLGPHLTQGLGAGANPEIGRQATEESLEEIKRILEVNTKMAFITVGMGGGTGTGGAPIIAKICKDLGILTVGIVTTPFMYEGKKRQLQAEEGIKTMKQYVDTLLIISNDKLRHQFGNLKMREAFAKADNVLATAAKCITDVISSTGQINVDFADVCTVMRNGGVAILGSATASGTDRAQNAIEEALNSPLLNDNEIQGAKWILININSSEGEHEFSMDEVEVIQNYLLSKTGDNSDVILGLGYDNNLDDKLGITLIATGFHHKDPFDKANLRREKKEEKILMVLGQKEEEKPKEEIKDEKQVAAKPSKRENLLAPRLVEEDTILETPMPTMKDIDGAPEQSPVIHWDLDVEPAKPVKKIVESTGATTVNKMLNEKKEEPLLSSTQAASVYPSNIKEEKVKNQDNAIPMPAASGGYLARPSNIYAETKAEVSTSKPSAEEPVSSANLKTEEEELLDLQMQIVERDDIPAADMPLAYQAHPDTIGEPLFSDVEEPAMRDEAEDQKRRAAERLQKLRNLSFNVNSADPNNEFETVPAYIRRNMELYSSSSAAENFYSNYEVKTDNNNQSHISTINTFLDGKKPD
ncbi:MAG: cell division protein FtsZ [Bacteroidetes bacterium]|nr:cell division protein FtsZ [Bacteroidota bacterium]